VSETNGSYGEWLAVYQANGDGTFTLPASSSVTGNVPSGIAVADFNGDGIPDLAIGSTNSLRHGI
jgi:hypothetical protein